MTNEELNRLCATEIMGWCLEGGAWVEVIRSTIMIGGSIFKVYEHEWSPTKNIAQAWQLLEKLDRRYFVRKNIGYFYNGTIYKNLYNVGIARESNRGDEITGEETAPLAITKACLKAKGVNIE